MTGGNAQGAPLVDGIFKIEPDGRPALLASRCASCNARFFPPRERCSSCSHDVLQVETAAQDGTLYTWTTIRELGGNREGFVPYTVGQVDLADGLRVTGIVQGDLDELTIGMSLRLCIVPQGHDAGGKQLIGYAFEPS